MEVVQVKFPRLCISTEERRALAGEIASAGGAEVLSAVTVTEVGDWTNLRILARGTHDKAPAVLRSLRPGDVLLHNHPGGDLRPSDADLSVASLCGRSGVGFAIHDDACRKMYVVVEPSRRERIEPIDEKTLVEALSGRGILGKILPNYEDRPGQVDLLRSIVQAFNEPCHALLEGETGIGKSMAYLLPAIHFANKNKARVCVSTNTINLQGQLCNKDLPLLQRVSGVQFTFCLVKGRGNYLCRRRLEEIEHSLDGEFLLEQDELEQYTKIKGWAGKTTDGSLSDMSFVPSDSLWEKIRSETDTCLGIKCRDYGACFFYRARRKSAEADILVVNHHLLFSDLAWRAETSEYSQTCVIPAFKAIILDEAHNLEEIATQHFGFRTTFFGIQRILGRLYSRRGRRERGVLAVLAERLGKGEGSFSDGARSSLLEDIRGKAVPEKEQIVDVVRELFSLITDFATGGKTGVEGEFKRRVTPGNRENESFKAIAHHGKRVGELLSSFGRLLRKVQKKIAEACEEDEKTCDSFEMSVAELTGFGRRFGEIRSALSLMFDEECENREAFVHFFTANIRKSSSWPGFHSAFIDVAPALLQNCFHPITPVVLLSGTLTTRKNFTFISSRLGLDRPELETRVIEGRFASPFDYGTQSRLFLPTDLPEPSSPEFIGKTADPVFEIVKTSRGGTLVLCTSNFHMRALHSLLEEKLANEGLDSFCQGEMERTHLLQHFRDHGNAVLFATDSFWEGIDVPGKALRNLVIAKLPFQTPDDPVLQARQELLEKNGKHPFREYQLPTAALKLKQGFGRLIRSQDDRGTVWILDKRLVTKFYGSYFLETLPPVPISRGPFRTLVPLARAFFEKGGDSGD